MPEQTKAYMLTDEQFRMIQNALNYRAKSAIQDFDKTVEILKRIEMASSILASHCGDLYFEAREIEKSYSELIHELDMQWLKQK